VAARGAGAAARVLEEPEPQPARRQAIRAVATVAARISRGRIVRPVGGTGPALEWAARMRRRVTFSRNLTLSLSRTCRCYCKYCAFATHKAHLYSPDEVVDMLDRAVSRHHVKELLVLTGEKPEVNASVAARLGVRARARAGDAAAHEPGRARP
jgi:2-iminoacetate synthase ThiH